MHFELLGSGKRVVDRGRSLSGRKVFQAPASRCAIQWMLTNGSMCLLLTGEGKGAVLSPLDMIFRGVEGIMDAAESGTRCRWGTSFKSPSSIGATTIVECNMFTLAHVASHCAEPSFLRPPPLGYSPTAGTARDGVQHRTESLASCQ